MRRRDETGSRGYLVGLLLALALTVVPFGLVHFRLAEATTALLVIAVCAIVQILVHLRWFLFVEQAPPREHLMALAFAALLVLLMVGGSLWIMTDLAHRMM
jgi:cytochrome o ubiquinol oxidase operon protein cyoD